MRPNPNGICDKCWAPQTSTRDPCWRSSAETSATRSNTTYSPTFRATATPRSPTRFGPCAPASPFPTRPVRSHASTYAPCAPSSRSHSRIGLMVPRLMKIIRTHLDAQDWTEKRTAPIQSERTPRTNGYVGASAKDHVSHVDIYLSLGDPCWPDDASAPA